MSLRILIDLQGAQNNSRHRGIGRYSLALAKGIARNAGEHRVFILLNGLFPKTIEQIQSSFETILPEDRFLVFKSPGPVSELVLENSWRRRAAEVLREYVIDALSPDVVLVSSMVEGRADDTITSLGSLKTTASTTAVIYDLIPLMDPDSFFKEDAEKLWYHRKIDDLSRANGLFAISHSTMNDAIRLLDVDPMRIRNISAAADSCFSSTINSPGNCALVAKRYGISRRFLMHSSAFDKRKNFQGLMRAYAALPGVIRSDYQLVLVCKLDFAGKEELSSLAANIGLTPQDLILTGFVPDDDLIALYTACHLFVFPSLNEGFGLPALEAMSCGTPTIGSNVTSVPEVIGREDALFDPTSVDAITALILKALTNTDFYQSLKTHARTQAAKFSWDVTALRAVAGMEAIVSQRSSRSGLPPTSEAAKRRNFMEALGEVSREFAPNDLEILELARSIDANDDAIRRLLASAAYGAA
jgi:glycosyltransferase involved in cell wall biosynthesis